MYLSDMIHLKTITQSCGVRRLRDPALRPELLSWVRAAMFEWGEMAAKLHKN